MNNVCIAVIGRNDVSHLKRSLTTASREAYSRSGCGVIYIDDASEDGSCELAECLAAKLGNVAVLQNKWQRNIGGARNAAVEYLSSLGDSGFEYVWFNDSDDFLTEGSIARVMDVIEKNNRPDCITVPLVRYDGGVIPKAKVIQNTIEEAPLGPVSECAYVFKVALYVKNVEGQRCEDCPWHYEQFDRFNSWAKVDGDTPCYVWDNTNPSATTRTVDFCARNSFTLMAAAFEDVLVKNGKNDRWISDNLRNLANMYDVRHKLTKESVKRAWRERFKIELCNFMNGFHVH